jgi:hypothetical protein
MRAEVLLTGSAITAFPAGRGDPGDTHALTLLFPLHDPANHLVPEDDRKSWRGSPALDLIQFRVTDPAACDPDEDLAFREDRFGNLLQ